MRDRPHVVEELRIDRPFLVFIPDFLAIRLISFGFIICPYSEPADVDMLSLINVPPKSFAPHIKSMR